MDRFPQMQEERTMRISVIRGSQIIMAAVALATLSALAHAQGQQDFSKVEIKTTQITNNFYTLEGQGGTIGVLVGPDGVFMVDDEFAPLTEKIVAAIRKISTAPIKFVVNTHVHGDHTGGNENLGKMGVTIVARENVRNRLMHPNPGANGAPGVPAPAAALPILTFNNPITFHMNGEDIQLIPVPAAHTDGDTMVRFVNADVIMCGDFYRSIQYPNIDIANGGSLNGTLDGLGQVIARSGPNTKIVPGHGPTVDRNAVMAQRDMILVIRDRVTKLVEQGKTQEEVLAAKPTADYDAKVPNSRETTQRFVTQLYAQLKPAK
jgi:cyclase